MATRHATMSTPDLIAEYNKQSLRKLRFKDYTRNPAQTAINVIVDTLAERADAGDAMAEEWFTAR